MKWLISDKGGVECCGQLIAIKVHHPGPGPGHWIVLGPRPGQYGPPGAGDQGFKVGPLVGWAFGAEPPLGSNNTLAKAFVMSVCPS